MNPRPRKKYQKAKQHKPKSKVIPHVNRPFAEGYAGELLDQLKKRLLQQEKTPS